VFVRRGPENPGSAVPVSPLTNHDVALTFTPATPVSVNKKPGFAVNVMVAMVELVRSIVTVPKGPAPQQPLEAVRVLITMLPAEAIEAPSVRITTARSATIRILMIFLRLTQRPSSY
jgi:hypothetical protein